MRSVREITQELGAKTKEIAPLAHKFVDGGLEGGELDQFRALHAEIETLTGEKLDAERLDQQARGAMDLNDSLTKSAGRVSGTLPQGEQRQRREERQEAESRYHSIGDAFIHSNQLDEYRGRVGMGGNSPAFRVGSFAEEHRAEMGETDGIAPEVRALVGNADFTGNLLMPQHLSGVVAPDFRPLPVRNLFAQGTTNANSVDFVKEGVRTNNAAEVAEATSLATGLKPESGFTLTTDNAPVRTIAHIIYATRQALDDVGQLRMLIDNFLIRGIEERIDRQLMIGNGTAPNLRGITATTGVQVLDAAYWTANPLPTAGASANQWDRLRRAMTRIRITGRARTSGIVMSPTLLEMASMQKDTAGNYLFAAGGPFGTGGFTSLWGVPVTEQEDLAANQAIVGDFARGAAVLDRLDAQIFVSDSNRDLFERNIITILGEARIAFPVFRPEAFANVTMS
jgi:HK97 family phage major capsid protein